MKYKTLIIGGVVMGFAFLNGVCYALSGKQGRFDGPTQSLSVPGQVPVDLTIKGRDDNIRVYPSDRFEVKYHFYLNGAKGIDSQKAARLFSKFKVQYSNGVLSSEVPASNGDFLVPEWSTKSDCLAG